MPLNDIRLLLSCHGWEDFPTYQTGDDAENLLNSWSALWHPALIRSANSLPSWQRVDACPENCRGWLLVAPNLIADQVPADLPDRMDHQGGWLLRDIRHRLQAVELLANDPTQPLATAAAESVADFQALAYVYLQVQLLTRQYRYSGSLDELHFERLVLAAAESACPTTSDFEIHEFQDRMQACFDLLAEERNRYLSNPIYLIDWTLATSDTAALHRQLEWPIAHNIHLGNARESIAGDAELVAALRNKSDENRLSLTGGELRELRNSLLGSRSLIENLLAGQATLENQFARPAAVYARQRFGMNGSTPGLCQFVGFRHGLHATIDGGRYPVCPDNSIRWQGLGSASLQALADIPADAALAETYLQLAGTISTHIDRQYAAVIWLAHWPDSVQDFHVDLANAAKYGETLGRFVTLEEYFESTDEPEASQRWTSDDYQSPFHKQALISEEPDSLSRWTSYWRALIAAKLSGACENMIAHLQVADQAPVKTQTQARTDTAPDGYPLALQLALATDQLPDRLLTDVAVNRMETAKQAFAEHLCASPRAASDQIAEPAGFLVVNPHHVPVRQFFQFDAPAVTCADDHAIYYQESCHGKACCVIDVPACGYVFLEPHNRPRQIGKSLSLVEADNVLRNEFFQLGVDSRSGGIRSVMMYHERSNLLSQQLAVRIGDRRQSRSRDRGTYSQVRLQDQVIEQQGHARASCISRGQLVHEGNVLCDFQQKTTVTRGIRVADLQIDIDNLQPLRPDPWNEYVCARFAWNDDAAQLYRIINESREAVTLSKIESPLCLEIEELGHSVTLFSDGLPFHRRDGYRILDSLLGTTHESGRRFNLGVGVDVKYPQTLAEQRLAPLTGQPVAAAPPMPTAFLYHFNARNVVPLKWETSAASTSPTSSEPASATVIWLKETQGQAAQLQITCPHAPARASLSNLQHREIAACELAGDRIKIAVEPYMLGRLSIEWKP